jgi:hypothetical protein
MDGRRMGPETLLLRERQLRLRKGPLTLRFLKALVWGAVVLAGVLVVLSLLQALIPACYLHILPYSCPPSGCRYPC